MKTSELVAALRRRDRSTQELFLRRYAPRVFSLTMRMLHHREDAEELTQDVMLRALQSIESYDERRASIQTWLWKIAYSMALTHLRNSVKPPRVNIDDSAADVLHDSPATTDILGDDSPETLELLHQAIDGLPAEDQGLIWLFYHEGRSLADIATITSKQPGTIATRLHRIRSRLRMIILKLRQQ